jgi:hypothetical protein
MKKIPRDITGYELIKIIGKFGYQITREQEAIFGLQQQKTEFIILRYLTIIL